MLNSEESMLKLCDWVRSNANCTFFNIKTLMSLVTVFVQDDERFPVVIWGVDDKGQVDYDTLLVGSEVIHVKKDFEDGMMDLKRRMEQLMKVKLTFLAELEDTLPLLNDETTVNTSRASFGLLKNNSKLCHFPDLLFKQLKNSHFCKNQGEEVNGENPKIVDWLKHCDDFMEMMIAAIYISSGSPCRATELASYLLSSTAFSNRNVFYMFKTIAFQQTYHKSIGIDNRTKNIVRFLPKDIAELFAKYLIYIRPIQS